MHPLAVPLVAQFDVTLLWIAQPRADGDRFILKGEVHGYALLISVVVYLVDRGVREGDALP